MKRKFSKILGVGLTLALLASLLVTGVPVVALTEPAVTVAPSVVGQTAVYTIVFTTTEDLAESASDDIRIEFPEGTDVPVAYVAADITINTIDAGGDVESVVDELVTIDVPEDVGKGTVTVVFKLTAAIKNPLAIDAYTLAVSTSREVTPVTSAEYNITAPEGPVDLYLSGTPPPLQYFASYDTIGEALVDADEGDTIRVHSNANGYDSSLETYPIDIDVVGGVIVESYDGAATTTIDASAESDTAAVVITAGGVTLGGDGVGFTIIATDYDSANASLDTFGIHLTNEVDDVTIEDNVITGGDLSPQLGILIGSTSGEPEMYSNIKILNNTINTTWDVDLTEENATCGGIKSWSGTTLDGTLLIDDNDITGFTVGMNLEGVVTGTEEAPAIISNNAVYGNGYNGIAVDKGEWVEICGNDIYGNGGNGVAIAVSAANVKVERNDIHYNGNGVKVYFGVTAANVAINYNNIYDNTNTTVTVKSDGVTAYTYELYGVFNANEANGSDLDAKYNFWSDPSATLLDISGPSSATYTAEEVDDWWAGTALGTGDIAGAAATSATVFATVLYDPWLTEPQATVIDSGKRSYGSDALLLEKGWNTLSVPCGLKGSADTFGEIELVGDFLTDANSDIGYSYDALANDWVLIDASTELEPGKGFHILMKAASRFPVLYFDGSLDLPAYDMYEGWNLIGSAFGIDSDDWGVAAIDLDREGEGYRYPLTALDSIQIPGSVVISPSVPGQEVAWATTVAHDGTNKMLVGEAYWVFMTADGTLAGFEVAPFCFEPGTVPD